MSTPRLAPRDREGHKGTFGRVLIVAGSERMPGAAALATLGALRGGAGLVTLASTASVLDRLTPRLLCATQLPLPAASDGSIDGSAADRLREEAERFDAFVFGPGLGHTPSTGRLLAETVNAWPGPLVLDADGLNALAARPSDWQTARDGEAKRVRVLTPHPGEFARLGGGHVATRAARAQAARAMAARWHAFVILKGAATVVTDGEQYFENSTGNPGLATGGSGDVLAGLLAALLVRPGTDPFTALCAGVHAHGLAADLWSGAHGQDGLIAEDVLDTLPAALETLVESAS